MTLNVSFLRSWLMMLVIVMGMVAVTGCGSSWKTHQTGQASWYGKPFHGRPTASGETFSRHRMTAAHASLPFGTEVRVVNQSTGDSVKVKINDRFPNTKGRIIDLSEKAFSKIADKDEGVVRVRLELED